jgi:hypothetical protein
LPSSGVDRGGKGSHRNYVHPRVSKPITISGKLGDDGDDEQAVFSELCQIVEEAIALYERDGKSLPPPTSGRDFANRMQRIV